MSLSNFIDRELIRKIDVLKIDTEGFEYNILSGLKKSDFDKIGLIYFEHHFDNMIKKKYKFSDINSLLNKNGFIQTLKIKMNFRKSFEYIYERKK